MKSIKLKRLITTLFIILLLSSKAFAMEQIKTIIDEDTVRLDYVDENKNLVCHPSLGYATIIRELDEKGRELTDFYFDIKGNPVAALSGEYGMTRVYNDQGQVSEFIFLNRLGEPVLISKGYGSIRRTYNEEGKADTDRFYDLDGNPVSLSRGQYGSRRIYHDGKLIKTVYIDNNGHEMFFLDWFLQKRPWFVMISMIVLLLAAFIIGRKRRFVLFFCYIFFIFYMTLYVRESKEPQTNLELFWSYRQMLEYGTVSKQVVYNIVLFIPLGVLTLLLFPKNGWIISFLLSVYVETLQYVTGTGLCEFDDVFNNTLGGMAGVVIAMIAVKMVPKIKDGLL